MTRPFPIVSDCSECHIGQTVAVHTAEIVHLKETGTRVEGKLDKLLWWIMATCATSAGALLGMALKK